MIDSRTEKKYEAMKSRLSQLPSLAVAFSGGVDSTLLTAAAAAVLGNRMAAITAVSPFSSKIETASAVSTAKKMNVRHILFEIDILGDADVTINSPRRCYYCKKTIFEHIKRIALEAELDYVAHGANADDFGDFRPGSKAAQEMGILAPLAEARLNKEEIRRISKNLGLPTWNKPAMACLASRIPYGTPLTQKSLTMVEKAEDVLLTSGLTQCRVRLHGEIARIEVPAEQIPRLTEPRLRQEIVGRFKSLGFSYVTLDLEGYVMGSLNRGLTPP